MVQRILIIEREYGCGAAEVAEEAARRLGWRLWDNDLTAEIAKLAKITEQECARREEQMDSWLYRLGETVWRGSYERALSVEGREILDADCMLDLVQQVVTRAAEAGQCVIVGRGAPYFLRNRADTFSTFLFAPSSLKISRVEQLLKDRSQAEELVDSVDRDRATFIKHYFGKDWPNRHLYHLMINTVIGIDVTVDVILRTMEAAGQSGGTKVDMD